MTRQQQQKISIHRSLLCLAFAEDKVYAFFSHWVSLVAQLVKSPAMWETWVRSLGWADPLDKEKATHSSILAWRIPWTVLSMGSQSVRHD